MKINSNFTIRNIAGTWVALPLGEATIDFTGMITLNESGVLLWRALEEGATEDELVERLLAEYDGVTDEMAREDVQSFVKKLSDAGCIEK